MIVNKIKFNISFHTKIVKEEEVEENKGLKSFSLDFLADALGTAFKNIDEAPVKL